MTSQPQPHAPDGPTVPRVPRRVGPYTLLAKIGEGGMGVVHLARRDDGVPGLRGGERVALKVMRPHIVGDEEARQRLAREVSSLERIRSRWVAEIVDADPWAEVPYVATRYVPGLSLHDHVQQEGPVVGDDLLWLAGCLAEGLAAVHASGVLHRDVKPSNVLMEGRTPVLIDFGLARVADDPRLTHTGWLLGTPGYLAPEILYGDDATAASDLHSWAATVAYGALGRAPFGRGPAMAIMDRVRRGEHDLAGLDGPLHDVVVAALDPEPERRPRLDDVLAWLRPQTTRPTPLLAAPPTLLTTYPIVAVGQEAGADGPAGDDPFADSLALVADAPTVVEPAEPAAPTRVETVGPTRVEPVAPVVPPPASRPAPPPAAPATHVPPPVAAPWSDPYLQPATYPEPGSLAPTPVEPASGGERVRRGLLAGAGALLLAAACALAPRVTLAVVVVATWLLRSGSLAASAVGARRERRGRRWYDGPQLLVQAPWRLVQAVPGAAMLLAWAGGLAVAAALVCYAVAAAMPLTLAAMGLVLGVSLWWGPGGTRFRGPLHRVVDPLSRRPGPWVAATAVVLTAALLAGGYVEARGTTWTPTDDAPVSTR